VKNTGQNNTEVREVGERFVESVGCGKFGLEAMEVGFERGIIDS